jgi:hypothetical protein
LSRIVIVILIYHRHSPIDSINLLGSSPKLNIFPVRYHKPIDLIDSVAFAMKELTAGRKRIP